MVWRSCCSACSTTAAPAGIILRCRHHLQPCGRHPLFRRVCAGRLEHPSELTLNLGIRYEIQTAPTYRHNVASVFNPTAPNPIGAAIGETLPGALQFLSSSQRGLLQHELRQRCAALWVHLPGAAELRVRGGYGIFYPPSISCCFETESAGFASTTVSPVTLNTISPNPAVTVANPWPNGFIPITGNSLGELQQVATGLPAISAAQIKLRAAVSARLAIWLTPNDRLDVNYVGNHGTHIITASLNRTS